MATPPRIPPPSTERQALIALANAFADLLQASSSSGGITLETAVAALLAGVVSRGADYSYGSLGAATITRDGQLHIENPALQTLEAILEELKALRQELQLNSGVIGG